MKFGCIFAVKVRQTFNDIQCCQWVFLYPYASNYRKDIAVSIPTGHPRQALSYVESLATFREADGFSHIHNSNFIGMPNSHEICAGAKHSNAARVSNPDTVQSTATIRMRCSNPYSIPVFEDFMAECQRRFDTEREAKNKAYYFIMSKGLDEDFREFCKEHDSRDSYKDCVNHLLSTMTIK